MAKEKLTIVIDGKEYVSREAQKAGRSVQGMAKDSKNAFGSLGSAVVAVNQGLEIARKAIEAIGKAIELAKLGAKSKQVEKSFRTMAENMGADANQVIRDLDRMSANTVASMDLMQSATRALMFNLPVDELDRLMGIARAAATATGASITQMFDDIVTGVARQSPMILDNLGLTIKIGEATEEYARQLGISTKEMSAAQRQQALLNNVLESGEDLMERMGEAATELTDLERWQQWEAQVAELWDDLGQKINNTILYVMERFAWLGRQLDRLFADGLGAQVEALVAAGGAPVASARGNQDKILTEDAYISGMQEEFSYLVDIFNVLDQWERGNITEAERVALMTSEHFNGAYPINPEDVSYMQAMKVLGDEVTAVMEELAGTGLGVEQGNVVVVDQDQLDEYLGKRNDPVLAAQRAETLEQQQSTLKAIVDNTLAGMLNAVRNASILNRAGAGRNLRDVQNDAIMSGLEEVLVRGREFGLSGVDMAPFIDTLTDAIATSLGDSGKERGAAKTRGRGDDSRPFKFPPSAGRRNSEEMDRFLRQDALDTHGLEGLAARVGFVSSGVAEEGLPMPGDHSRGQTELGSLMEGMGDSLAGLENFGTVLQVVTGQLGLLTAVMQPVIDGFLSVIGPAIENILQPLFDVLFHLGETVGELLLPLFSSLAPVIDLIVEVLVKGLSPALSILAGVVSLINPILMLLQPVLTGIAIAFEILTAPIKFVADLFEHLAKSIEYFFRLLDANPANDNMADPGAFESDAFTGLEGRINDIIAASAGGGTEAPSYGDTLDDWNGTPRGSGGGDGPTIHGGSTTITQPPDINVTQNFHGPIVGAGGMREFGEYTVEAIQEYVGAGGQVSFA